MCPGFFSSQSPTNQTEGDMTGQDAVFLQHGVFPTEWVLR